MKQITVADSVEYRGLLIIINYLDLSKKDQSFLYLAAWRYVSRPQGTIWYGVNPFTANLSYLNFYPLEVVYGYATHTFKWVTITHIRLIEKQTFATLDV